VGGNEEEDVRCAFGLGMVAGMLHAASTGATLNVPPLAELKAALDAQDALFEARKAASDTPQVA
jgi:hypothetical protein